ncbi:MAG: hypothetical protein CMJ89_07730 [Planctomycetes bacterium]|jgi:hypothetical protein|nr:hypothetical protein [Planctomycetota bacterium]
MKRGRTRSLSSSSRRSGGGGKHLRGSASADGGLRSSSASLSEGSTGGFSVEQLLESMHRGELEELVRFWGGDGQDVTDSEDHLRDCARGWMSNPALVEERVADLGRRRGAVLESLIGSPGYVRSREELNDIPSLRSFSEYEIDSSIAGLMSRGLIMQGEDRRFERYGKRVLGVPHELGDGLVRRRRKKQRGIFSVLTLRGHLDQTYSEKAPRLTPQRVRELYKMYSQETAATARIERLPDGVRGLVEKAILEFGGVLPRHLFDRMETRLPHWNGRRWRNIIEQSLIGTVQELNLSRYGIQLQDETLIVFNEIALAWLRRVAVPGDPDSPHEELSIGIDLVSNISRFLGYIDEHGVRFTVRGEIFKTTEKKILQNLIPNHGRELSREEVLRFIFRFAKRRGLIDRTGKRTFLVTAKGRQWDGQSLVEKQGLLLDFALAERRGTSEHLHQVRMREIFMRLLKRIEVGTWYDLMYLPFLARNTYLSTLDDFDVEERFTERSKSGRMPPMEDPQRLAWNLIRWARKRLFLLGMIDMGYDAAGRPVALRASRHGLRVLGLNGAEEEKSESVGALVVTPDFEVVLFPTGDDDELIHDLDRFAERDTQDSVLRFRIAQSCVGRALKRGMQLDSILDCLNSHARTPVPQNVSFSIRDWALGAGLMRLSDELRLVCEQAETMKRFLQDAGTRRYVGRVIDERQVQLHGRITPRRMRALLRDLGYLVELGEPIHP